MKSLHALIGKHNIKNAQKSNRFNVFNLDLEGMIKDWPFELLVYTLEEVERQGEKVTQNVIRTLQELGVAYVVDFSKSKDGSDFWWDITKGDFTTFWKIYNRQK